MKIIIENKSEKADNQTALERVSKVISGGRVSNNNKQYCYLTVFGDGICVSTTLNKKSDKFIVWDER
jgi:hypothetical protein